jgi:putative transposase
VQPHERISQRRQCALLGLSRSTLYLRPAGESEQNLELMRWIDEQYTQTPYYGSRKLTWWLNEHKRAGVNRKRVARLMHLMGIEAVYPKPRLSVRHPEHRVYPYLLADVTVERPNHVWSTDITYVRMRQGFMYLMAIIDWFSRYVLAWRLSNSLESAFCLEAIDEALGGPQQPLIFNTDQGVQFTSVAFTDRLRARSIAISMDGRGRAFDNIFIERLWRSVKYEHIYLHDYQLVDELSAGLRRYWVQYNTERPHQALGYQTPAAVYFGRADAPTLAARRP